MRCRSGVVTCLVSLVVAVLHHHFHLAAQLSSISRHWSVSLSVSQWWPASDMKFLLLTPLVPSLVVISVSGHGFLFDPPARNAMWR